MAMTATPHDYHNSLADVPDGNAYYDTPQQVHQERHHYDGSLRAPGAQLIGERESEMELAAFERGRMQGEVEAVRRLEAEGQLGGVGGKTFVNNNDTTIINAQLATANVVEIEHLTWLQKLAALFGEACSIGYIVIMAYWIDQHGGGVDDWSNTRGSGLVEQFNIHIVAAFVGLFAACQAYVDYRILPLRTRPFFNTLLYIAWQVLALACFGITIAAAILSQPGSHMRSMHAWTAMLAVFVYAAHAIYSIFKVLFTHDTGVQAHKWNESVNIAEAPTHHNMHLSAEQRRDHNLQLPTLYRAAPTILHRPHHRHHRHHATATQYNADGSINHDAAAAGAAPVPATRAGDVPTTTSTTGASPVWSESPAYTANNFFLVPRAKWAVASLIGLVAATLIGLGELQVLRASNGSPWASGGGTGAGAGAGGGGGGDGISLDTSDILLGVIGLATLAGVMSLAYAAMPPRTVVAKGNFGQMPLSSQVNTVADATAPSTARNSVSIQPTGPIQEEVV